ncbi:MAG: transposase [Planctomycetaceae bacterium]|nr:transposase [Planctomycetaceae bacterium]
MAKRRVYDRERHAHFVTFSCYRRRRLLDDDRAKRIVLGTLNAQLRRLGGRCVGFVIMPNHVHALVWFAEPGQLSEFMKQWKRTSSRRIGQLLATTLVAYAGTLHGSRIWQAKYYGFNIYSRRKMEEKLTYMHLNPVRAGLVREACQWRWSSARHYELGKSVGVEVGWIE